MTALMNIQMIKIEFDGDQRKMVFKLVDRRDKMPPADWDTFALESGLSQSQLDDLKKMLNDRELWRESPEMRRLFAALEVLGASAYVRYDPQIVRGLDYYTGTVFEARDLDREGRDPRGGAYETGRGSRWDALPGIGFAMADVMIRLILEKYNCLPEIKPSPAIFGPVFNRDLWQLTRISTSFVRWIQSSCLPKRFVDKQ